MGGVPIQTGRQRPIHRRTLTGFRVSMPERKYILMPRQSVERLTAARSRLAEALAIVDGVAQSCMLSNPAHAFALLSEDEQARLYTLLKGD